MEATHAKMIMNARGGLSVSAPRECNVPTLLAQPLVHAQLVFERKK
jgi:hypothetical protein